MSDYVKHTTHTDALDTLGMIIGGGEQRDAIHLAVEPVVAALDLVAGKHVGRMPDGSYGPHAEKLVGIVDPFLLRGPTKGQRFWLVVYPRQITSLRHHWEHPDFPAMSIEAGPDKSASEKWMRTWAMEHMSEDYYGPSEGRLSEETAYAMAIEAGRTKRIGPYEDARDHIDGEWWAHWEAITGQIGDRDSYFSCAC